MKKGKKETYRLCSLMLLVFSKAESFDRLLLFFFFRFPVISCHSDLLKDVSGCCSCKPPSSGCRSPPSLTLSSGCKPCKSSTIYVIYMLHFARCLLAYMLIWNTPLVNQVRSPSTKQLEFSITTYMHIGNSR